MKMKKYSFEDFKKLAAAKGLNICHISRKMVYVIDPPEELSLWWPIGIQPVSIDSIRDILFATPSGIDAKIMSIKAIRSIVPGMGLKDAKDFVEVNFFGFERPL